MTKSSKPEAKLVISPQAVMNHFCWAYCNALLQKLLSLDEEDKVFEKGAKSAWERAEQSQHSPVTAMAMVIIRKIEEQIGIDYGAHFQAMPTLIGKIIKETEEFLNIFKTNKEQIKINTLTRELSSIILENCDSHECADDIVDLLKNKYKLI